MKTPVIEMAENVLVQLGELQPSLSMSKLNKELHTLNEIRGKVGLIIAELTPDYPDMEKLVAALQKDVFSTFEELKSQVMKKDRPAAFTDQELTVLTLTAELFISRCQDYLSSKESLERQNAVSVSNQITTEQAGAA